MNRYVLIDDLPLYYEIEYLPILSKYCSKLYYQEYRYINYHNGMNYYIRVNG